MRAVQEDKERVLRDFIQQQKETEQAYKYMSLQIEVIKKEAADAKAKKEDQEKAWKEFEKAEQEKTMLLFEQIAELSMKLVDAVRDKDKVNQAMRDESRTTREMLNGIKLQQKEELENLNKRLNKRWGIFCSTQ